GPLERRTHAREREVRAPELLERPAARLRHAEGRVDLRDLRAAQRHDPAALARELIAAPRLRSGHGRRLDEAHAHISSRLWGVHQIRGSRASRRPSPRTFSAITMPKIINPG